MASYPKKTVQQPAIVHEPALTGEPATVASFDADASLEAPPVSAPVVVAAEAAKAEAAKPFQAPMASLQDIQAKARGLVEKGLVETRANYTKAKSAADEATSAIEASYGAAKSGVVEFNLRAIDALKASADANFDFVKSLASAKSMSEYVALHTEFARKQFEAATAHSKEFATLARKVADEAVAPIKAHVSKTFKVAV